MDEAQIKLAEKLGLSHRAPAIERRAFLRGMLATGALIIGPAGLALPEKRVCRVREQSELGKPATPGIIETIPDPPLAAARYEQPRAPTIVIDSLSYAFDEQLRLKRTDADMLPRDSHLEGAARRLGVSYEDAKARLAAQDPQVTAARNDQKCWTFGERYAAAPAAIQDAIRRSLPPGTHRLIVDEVNVTETYLAIIGRKVG